jgi:hypothetical protein
MDTEIFEETQKENDFDFLTNTVFNLNKNLDTNKESYQIELLEVNDNKLKIFYVHDFYKDDIPTLEHHTEIIELKDLYKKHNDTDLEKRLKEIIESYSQQNIQ